MLTQRSVVHWLVITAILLLVVGVSTYQRIGRRVDQAGLAVASDVTGIVKSQALVAATSAFALLSVLFAGLQMRRESQHRRRVEHQLQDALASVERQVADRTEALTEARRVAEEASQLKDEFLATASHELRTPLNAIVGWIHVLQLGSGTDEAQRQQALAAIARNATIQTRLIEDLLDVSRLMQGRVSLTVAPLDAGEIVDAAVDAVRAAATAKDLALTFERHPEPLPIIGDPLRLQQVIGNLLANAVKYTPTGGRIGVSTTAVRGRVVVGVADSGEGIAAAFLPHVFDPFRQGASTTRRAGMGLGLAIVRRLVALHGGEITVDSAGVGQGARFTVSLPLAPAPPLAADPVPASEPMFQKLHVLVAEDDADSAAAVTAILRLHGCETQTAGTASECLRITAEWPTDVLVCDIGLPDDDGYGLLKRLRSRPDGQRIPAIALTAYARPEDRARALAAGFRAHLSKPLNPASLMREISLAISAVPA